MPTTFKSTKHRSAADYFDVTYKVIADWEPADLYETPSQSVTVLLPNIMGCCAN